jgi:hypothetical protein
VREAQHAHEVTLRACAAERKRPRR